MVYPNDLKYPPPSLPNVIPVAARFLFLRWGLIFVAAEDAG
jgi:hypothetical protein